MRSRRWNNVKTESLLLPADGLLLAFFIPVLVLLVVFAGRGIFPFGDETYLRTDMYHQYAPFFSAFQHKLQTGDSLLYDWDVGMGVNFAALYAYYLASPVNWLTALVPKALLLEFMTLLITLKTGLCGLTFTWYLRRHYGRDAIGAGFFGAFYALSGYMCAYSWNIMWLDCIWLFPLIMLGVERLMAKKQPLLYTIALALSILSNYYISIMICIFMVIYAPALPLQGAAGLSEKGGARERLGQLAQRFALFAGASLMAGALAAAVLLPEIYALKGTASGEVSFPRTAELYFPIFDMLARHLAGVQVETGLDHWPNIFCGTAVLLLLPLYFANPRIKSREKMVYGGLLLFLLASFSINVLNFIWHGLHYPNSLPCRQSFIYIFLVLSMCCEALLELDGVRKSFIGGAFAGGMMFIVLAQHLMTDEDYHWGVFFGAMALLALYGALLWVWKTGSMGRILPGVLAAALVLGENIANTAITSVPTTNRTQYLADNAAMRELTGSAAPRWGFTRFDKLEARTKNDGAWMNFHTASLFSSVASADVTDFFKKMGAEGSTNAYATVGATPLMEALLATQYVIAPEPSDDPDLALVREAQGYYLYEMDSLPLGFALPEEMRTGWHLTSSDPAENQNGLAAALGLAPVLVQVPSDEQGEEMTFRAPEAGKYFITIGNKSVKKVTLTAGERSKTFSSINRGFFTSTGYVDQGQQVKVEISDPDDVHELRAVVYRFDDSVFRQILEKLRPEAMTVELRSSSRLTGKVTMEADGTLFLSIPYDAGWQVTIDGKKSIINKIYGAFCQVQVPRGEHAIEFRYRPQGLGRGMAVSGISLIILLLYIMRGRKIKKKEINHDQE